MSWRSSAVAMIACVSVLAVAPLRPTTALAAEGVSVREVDLDGFPTVRLVVSTPRADAIDPRAVEIVENGVPVEVVGVSPLAADVRGVDAVLAIDVSNSMRGELLATALAAARTFLDGVPDSMPLGVLTFADRPIVRSPLTDERSSVERAVTSIGSTTAPGTSLFDAVATAARMFDPRSNAQHNLILVTDGKNRSGSQDIEGAIAAAGAAQMHVFTVGLAGPATDQSTLQTLARRTGGSYAAISPDQLDSVYAGLARQFTGQYVVEYRSKTAFGTTASVWIGLPIGSASVGFLAPGLPVPPVGGPRAGETISFWTEPGGMGVVAAMTFLAVGAVGVLISRTGARRRRERQLRSRLVTPIEAPWGWEGSAPAERTSFVPPPIAEAAERLVGASAVGRRLSHRLEQAGWAIRSGELLTMAAVAAVVLGGVGFAVARVVGGLLGVALGAVGPFAAVSHAAARRRLAIQAQLADTLMVIASSMRAGHSFMQSLDSAAKEIDEPASGEFRRVLTEIRLGRDTDEALEALVARVGSQDLEWAVTAIGIQRKIGGNLAEVLETVAKTIREREMLRRQVRVLSAEGRISVAVLTVLPILIAAYLMIVNPDYLRTLTTTTPGIVISISAGALMAIGYLWMRRIVKLDV